MLLALFSLAAALAGPPAWMALPDVLVHPPELPIQRLDTSLTPIGFSPRGAFAYVVLPPDEAIGCFLWDFVIVDLVTDKELLHRRWSDDQDKNCEAIIDRPTLMKAQGKAFQADLDKHGIVPLASAALRPVPVPHGDDVVDVRLVPGPMGWPEPGEAVVPLAVSVRSKKLGQKNVGVLELKGYEGMSLSWGHEVAGVLLSPHEARMVVVITYEARGWEGPPNPQGVQVFGASLDKGFAVHPSP